MATDLSSSKVPCKYEQHSKESQNVFLAPSEAIDGFRLGISKSVSQSQDHDFSVSHILNLVGNPRIPSDLTWGLSYQTAKSYAMARIDTNGMVTAQSRIPLDEGLAFEGVFQAAGPNDFVSGEIEWKGTDFIASGKANSHGTASVSYMQTLLPNRLQTGVSCEYSFDERKSHLGFCGRLETSKDSVFSVDVNPSTPAGLQVQSTYFFRASDRLAYSAECSIYPGKRAAQTKAGYDFTFFNARFRSAIDSDGKVNALLEQKLYPGVTFALSGELNHPKSEYKFGFGLAVGAP